MNALNETNIDLNATLVFHKYPLVNFIINSEEEIEQVYPEEIEGYLIGNHLKLHHLISDHIYFAHFKNVLEKVKSTNITEEFTFQLNGKNPKTSFKVSISPLKSVKSQIKYFDICIKSINELENNYKQIFDYAILGIYQFDVINNEFLSVNPELSQILGFKNANDLLIENNTIQLLNINRPNRSKILELLNESDEIHGFETELLINGKKIWISENIRAIRENGIIYQLIGSIKDISERKSLIERLQVTKDDWQRTFDAIEEVIIILDKELKITRLNKAALKEYNTFTDNPEGIFCTNLYNIGESHCNTCPARATILDLKPHAKEVEYESLGKTFLTSSLPIFDDSNEFVGVVFIAKNITEKKKLKTESERRLQQVILADRLKSLGELVANVAHEINNPNNFVVQNISLLEKSWKLFQPIIEDYITHNAQDAYDKKFYSDLSNEMIELIDSIKVGSKRISNVVSNLKGFAKADEDKFEMISINKAIKSSLKIIQSKINKSFTDFSLDFSDNLPTIYGDFQKIEQVIINLVVNSIQARRKKVKSALKISTKFIERLNAVYIEVLDNGQGIPNKIIPKLFDPFFTTRREDGGTGLGLSISQEIIIKHNGIIDIHSVVGKGSLFKIYLPLENHKLENLNSRMLCLDYEDSIFKEDIVCFLGKANKQCTDYQIQKKICEYLKSRPEIDILLINASIVDDISKLIDELFKINSLYELILFKTDNEFFLREEKSGIKIVSSNEEKEIIIEINKILNTLSR